MKNIQNCIPKLFVMCGLAGSGKSTEAQRLAEQHDANIHSSDAIRQELLGDINAQDANGVVFATLHNRVKEDLRNGKNCIYDATNTSYKRRMAFLNELKNIPCEKICVLMATPYCQCLTNNASRNRRVPEYVIERMYRHFDIPWYYEGWDQIEVRYFDGSENSYGLPQNWMAAHEHYDQYNSHHNLTLGDHCKMAVWHLDKNEPTDTVRYATMIHDCGKPFCQTFVNGKGIMTEQAHYYDHEHAGSYMSLFFEMPCNHLLVAVLIRWHMMPYIWEKDNNEKLHNKYRNLWGDGLYRYIMQLHEADRNAH